MADLDAALAQLAADVRLERAGALVIAGKRHPPRAALLALRTHLYERHFAGWTPPQTSSGRLSGDPAFVEPIAETCASAVTWEGGWTVVRKEGDWSFVSDGRLQLFAHDASELRPSTAQAGDPVLVRVPCLREGMMPGFLYAMSRAGPLDPRLPNLRLYLNVRPSRAAWLLARLLLDPAVRALRFEAKIANDPACYQRRDPAVLYASPECYAELERTVLQWRQEEPQGWREETPLFTEPLAPGVALAESPPGGARAPESFGQHRSRLLAEAILEGVRAGQREPSSWRARFEARLKAEDIDPACMHLQRLRVVRSAGAVAVEASRPPPSASGAYLEGGV